jgi:hypothetical protein
MSQTIITKKCPICQEPHFAKDCMILRNTKCAICGEYGHFTAYHGAHVQFLEKVKRQNSEDIWAVALKTSVLCIMPSFEETVQLLIGPPMHTRLSNASKNAPEEKQRLLKYLQNRCPEIEEENCFEIVQRIHKKHFSTILQVLYQEVLLDEIIVAEYEIMFGEEPNFSQVKEIQKAGTGTGAGAGEEEEEDEDDGSSICSDDLDDSAEEARLGIVIRC